MKKYILLVSMMLMIIVVACAPAPAPTPVSPTAAPVAQATATSAPPTPTTAQAPAPDLAAILRQHYDATNRGDGIVAAQFFTDDAEVMRSTCSAALAGQPCKGKAAIQKLVDYEKTRNTSYNITNVQVAGDTVTARVEFRNVAFTPIAAIERLINNVKATFKGDKISQLVHEDDLSDARTGTYRRLTGACGPVHAGITAGDAARAKAVFTDDAIFQMPIASSCPAGGCVGKAAIEKEIDRQLADKTTYPGVAGVPLVISGDNLVNHLELRSDTLRKAGVERLITDYTCDVKGTKVSSLRITLNLTDPQTAKYNEVLQMQPTPKP